MLIKEVATSTYEGSRVIEIFVIYVWKLASKDAVRLVVPSSRGRPDCESAISLLLFTQPQLYTYGYTRI